MLEKRTKLDFKNHVFTVKEEGNTTTYTLKKPNTVIDSLIFVNTAGILAVTGDYGNWIFCREFHTSTDGYVCDGYWIEKLKISSSKVPSKFDPEGTTKEIEDNIKEIEEEFNSGDISADVYQELKDYYESLLACTDDEVLYTYRAYREMPSCMDYEYVPFVKELSYWLLVVFDAFDEMCKRCKLEVDVEVK